MVACIFFNIYNNLCILEKNMYTCKKQLSTSHTLLRGCCTHMTFNQLKNTKLQFKQLSLMQNYLNMTL